MVNALPSHEMPMLQCEGLWRRLHRAYEGCQRLYHLDERAWKVQTCVICRLPLWEAAAVPLMLMRVNVWLPVLSCRPTAKGLWTAVLPLAASKFTLKAAITSICLPRKADGASSRACIASTVCVGLLVMCSQSGKELCSHALAAVRQQLLAEVRLFKSAADAFASDIKFTR